MVGELFVDDVPLLGKERVCDAETGTNGGGRVLWGDGGRGAFCPLARELALEHVDGSKETMGIPVAGLDSLACTEGIVTSEGGMAM